MAELRRAQQRRRNMKRGGVVGVAVLIALVLALWSGGAFSSGSKKKTTTSTATTVPKAAGTTTTVPAASATPRTLAQIEADLVARTPPAHSATCSNPSTGKSPAATVPAKPPAVAVISAPKAVGFPNLNGSAPHYTKFAAAPPFCINPADTYTATMKTTAGTIVITLLPKYAPITVNNFVFLAGYHYFDGIVFHRVIPAFVDQGGDPTGTGSGGPGYTFKDELPKNIGAYDAGSVAMANSGANTNGSQFFLVDGIGGSQLTNAYTMFGQITGGLDVANKINAAGTSAGTPKTLYKMISVTISASAGASTPTITSVPTTTKSSTATTTKATS
jgi:cyclophilin family peptidyl-prolyl cis-trans isomerase